MLHNSSYWKPPKLWEGDTVFIIGGGDSLRGTRGPLSLSFDVERIKGFRVIGVNDAYLLGPWVDCCFFGDHAWFKRHYKGVLDFDEYVGMPGLLKYNGLKVTCCQAVAGSKGIHLLQLRPCGLHTDPGYIGWNNSSGAASINLAINFGAKRVVLLGYDGHRGTDGAVNWHKNITDVKDSVFDKQMRGFVNLNNDILCKRPDVEILNANPDSSIDLWPKVTLDEAIRITNKDRSRWSLIPKYPNLPVHHVEEEEVHTVEGLQEVSKLKDAFPLSTWTIVGKGPTGFDYSTLSEAPGPVVFINDAVQLEKYLRKDQPSFFFAHDSGQSCWINQIKSVPVLPLSSKDAERITWERLCGKRAGYYYLWQEAYLKSPGLILTLSKEDVAASDSLFISSGTLHSAIHLAWLAGAERILFVGCDARTRSSYDGRIENKSGSRSKGANLKIKKTAEWLCRELGIEFEFVLNSFGDKRTLPKKLHFVWLGGEKPTEAKENIQAFRQAHPEWEVHVWTDKPDDLSDDLSGMYERAELWCQRADIVRLWVLWKYGGIYLDCDMKLVKPLDPLLKQGMWVCRHTPARLNNAAIGCPQMDERMAALLRALPSEEYKRARAKYGPNFLTSHQNLFNVLPATLFYPWDRKEKYEANKDASVPNETFAVHTWGIDGSGHRKVEA